MYTAVGISRLVYLGFNFGLVQNPQSRNAALQVNTVPLRKDCPFKFIYFLWYNLF